MKKLFFVFILTAVLCGCDNGGKTREVIFIENPPNLTTVTTTTTSFVDTFSDYMATYSGSETSSDSENGRGAGFSRPPGGAPDTVFRGEAEQVSRDTPANFTYLRTEKVSDFTDNSQNLQTGAVTEVPVSESKSVTTSVAETTAVTEITAETESTETATVTTTVGVPRDTAFRGSARYDTVYQNSARGDTAFSPAASADTAYSNTSNGGTNNAD
ncbi:MAG: hypothetical protein NC253_03595 [Ruminococcus sp.]|nr:hypothetical protein [Ruminococcus sp.]MCM1381388.1 hypothetical protein [Muribaculaceae bacterium]MCM1479510.1 hypothetical protein [Muribaculaceae bacterium]